MPLPQLKKLSDTLWELPSTFKKGMNVPAHFYATEPLIKTMDEAVFQQAANVACLPGIQKASLCMADGHSGYGFPVGGVAAFDPEDNGIISPGGVGFDVNCGMRLLTTNLTVDEVKPRIKDIVNELFKRVPTGVGCKGKIALTQRTMREVLQGGARWAVENGYGWEKDLHSIEDDGVLEGANEKEVSAKAAGRGMNQLGTLGSGNHYLEVQLVTPENIVRKTMAKKFGIKQDHVVLMLHCGSRGTGHQICSEYTTRFLTTHKKLNDSLPDKELASAPFHSKEGQAYYSAMKCAANFALANRQVITHRIRETLSKVFKEDAESLGIETVYDVSHNLAKLEPCILQKKIRELVVHRKGATRSYGPGHPALHKKFQDTGQPVIVGGSMETGSYLLVGTKHAEEETFGSTLHGSGRTMSRTQARNTINGSELQQQLLAKGIYVKTNSLTGLAEEAGSAYKDINTVVDAMELANISLKVCRLIPLGNIKGVSKLNFLLVLSVVFVLGMIALLI